LGSTENTGEYEYYDESEESVSPSIDPETLNSLDYYKHEKIEIRKFDSEKWKAVTGTINYDERPEKKKTKQNPPTVPNVPWNSNVLRIIAFILIIAVILLILYFVLKNTSFNRKVKEKSVSLADLSQPVESIDDLDINSLLEQAIRSENYKVAIRLYFLGLLKKLNAHGLIIWKKDKTNHDYLTELFSRPYFEGIRGLTLAYERVWYGEHPLSAESFRNLENDFKSMNQQVSTATTP
jgi:predicted secreted protein